nr:carbonic anhydrase [Mycolicibacterium lacusdiani]
MFGPQSPLIDVSTWGHTIDASVLASIEHAVEAMEVPLIVVLGHDDCSAMRAALHAWESAELPSGAMRATVEHALLSVVHRGTTAATVESITTAHIAQTGLLLMQRSPVVARLVDAEKLGIVCATYDDAERRFRLHATVGIIGEDTRGLVECV